LFEDKAPLNNIESRNLAASNRSNAFFKKQKNSKKKIKKLKNNDKKKNH